MSAICGHERDRLVFVLERADTCPGECDWKMVALVHDPAKLAELLAETLRGFGFVALSEDEFAQANEVRVRAFGDQVMVARRLRGAHKIGGPLLELPHARAALLRILELPNGATAEDAMKALGNASR